MQVLRLSKYLDRQGVSQSLTGRASTRRAFAFAGSVAFAVTALLLSTGCGSPVSRGTVLYRQQNYIEAAEAFEHTQGRLVAMEPVERARYGLYRGLTFIALGDLRGAERWLDYAEAMQRAQPTLLPVEDRALLARARLDLTVKLRAGWPKPDHDISQGVAASSVARDATMTR